jgi:hypothetical protein
LFDDTGGLAVHGPRTYGAQQAGKRVYLRWKLTPDYQQEKERLLQFARSHVDSQGRTLMGARSEAAGLDATEMRRLIALYNLEDYLFRTVSPRFKAEGTLDAHDFFAIVVWKSNRAKTLIRAGLANTHTSVHDLLRAVFAARTPAEKVETLIAVPGIGLPMASAILTVCYPDDFTVLDYRAWATLRALGYRLPKTLAWNARGYLKYCDTCKRIAAKVGVSLRDLDRALWAKSWEGDLQELTGKE